MKVKTVELKKGKKEEKTYAADVVKAHIHMYAQMVHLTDNWSVIMSSDVREVFRKTIERVQNEFLEEFKDEKFYYYLDKMEEILKR